MPPVLIDGNKEMSWFEAYIQHDDAAVRPLIDLLRSPQRPTAIFAVNDWIALQAQRAIALAGLNNPANVSVVGFDDLDIAQYQNPPLTTVARRVNGAERHAAADVMKEKSDHSLHDTTRRVVAGQPLPHQSAAFSYV